MINALHSSRDNGTKAFQHKGSTFGWIDIYKMWMRECERKDQGHARMIPRLRETHIIRDSWTKLNVSPAKIMQVHSRLIEWCCIQTSHAVLHVGIRCVEILAQDWRNAVPYAWDNPTGVRIVIVLNKSHTLAYTVHNRLNLTVLMHMHSTLSVW